MPVIAFPQRWPPRDKEFNIRPANGINVRGINKHIKAEERVREREREKKTGNKIKSFIFCCFYFIRNENEREKVFGAGKEKNNLYANCHLFASGSRDERALLGAGSSQDNSGLAAKGLLMWHLRLKTKQKTRRATRR